MVVGSLARQKRGAWLTTTANLWGSLALDKFSAKFESTPVAGRTSASLAIAVDGHARRRRRPRRSPCRAQTVADWSRQASGAAARLAWPPGAATLNVVQEGTGKPWLTVQSLAAIPLKAPLRAGYDIARSVSAVEQKDKSKWSRGDVVKVRLEIDAQSDMTWVVVSDPVPGGATILGSGLGRDSQIATRGERRAGQRVAGVRGARLRGASAATTSTCRAASTSSSTRCASTIRAASRCRRRASRRCMRPRASAKRRTRRSRSRRDDRTAIACAFAALASARRALVGARSCRRVLRRPRAARRSPKSGRRTGRRTSRSSTGAARRSRRFASTRRCAGSPGRRSPTCRRPC